MKKDLKMIVATTVAAAAAASEIVFHLSDEDGFLWTANVQENASDKK